MCGIFGYAGKRSDAGVIAIDGLKNLEYRGYDSWGIAVRTTARDHRIFIHKKTGKIGTPVANETLNAP